MKLNLRVYLYLTMLFGWGLVMLNYENTHACDDKLSSLGKSSSHELLIQAGLVKIDPIETGIVVDIPYASTGNFTNTKVYPANVAYLRKEVVEALLRVHQRLVPLSLGLKIWDAYRPFSVQEFFWEVLPDSTYVLEPKREREKLIEGSRHNRGAAVDVTIVKLGETIGVEMPTGFDDFSPSAFRENYHLATRDAQRNAKLLEEVMNNEGFEGFPNEWWHFDYRGWEQYELLDIPID